MFAIGLSAHGSSQQTIAIAIEISSNPGLREEIIRQLNNMGSPEKYSNEGLDRQQNLAALLADAARRVDYSQEHWPKRKVR